MRVIDGTRLTNWIVKPCARKPNGKLSRTEGRVRVMRGGRRYRPVRMSPKQTPGNWYSYVSCWPSRPTRQRQRNTARESMTYAKPFASFSVHDRGAVNDSDGAREIRCFGYFRHLLILASVRCGGLISPTIGARACALTDQRRGTASGFAIFSRVLHFTRIYLLAINLRPWSYTANLTSLGAATSLLVS